jgi:hypothetical protein
MTDRPATPRPDVPTEPTASSPAEQFQNQTLRPVLKQINSLIVSYFKHHYPKRKVNFAKLTEADKLAYIERAIRDDTKLRLTLVGMVLGQFSLDEWAAFVPLEAEVSRRIQNLIIQRLQSRVGEL